MGFRTNTRYSDEDIMLLWSITEFWEEVLHSTFQNVREKASLAYYAFSRIEKTKGLMLISSGIDFDDKNKAIDIIKQQLEELKNGKISDYEFDSTIKSLTNSYKEATDNPSMIISLYLDGIINGVQRSAEELLISYMSHKG